MKTIIKIFLIIVIMIILSTCSSEEYSSDRLELYILRLDELSSDFVKDENPIFTGEDILSYDWDTHTIIFKDYFLSIRNSDESDTDLILGGSKILGVYYPDQFAFYLDGKELYRGYMKPQAFISFMPVGPMISDSDKGIVIDNNDNNFDIRNDKKLYEFLKLNDKLK